MAKVIKHRSVEERKAQGKASREQTQLASHTDWEPAADRPDPVALLEEQNTTREQDLGNDLAKARKADHEDFGAMRTFEILVEFLALLRRRQVARQD